MMRPKECADRLLADERAKFRVRDFAVAVEVGLVHPDGGIDELLHDGLAHVAVHIEIDAVAQDAPHDHRRHEHVHCQEGAPRVARGSDVPVAHLIFIFIYFKV